MKNKILNLPFKKLTSLFTAIIFFCNIIAPLPAVAQTTASRKVDYEKEVDSCYKQSPDTVEEFIKNCIPDNMYTVVTVGGRWKSVLYNQLDDKQLKTKINKVYFHRQLLEAQEFTEYLDTDLLFNEVLGSIYPGLTPEEIDERYASDYEKMTEFMNTKLSTYSGGAMSASAKPSEFFPAARGVVYYAIKKSDFIPRHPYFTQPANGEIGNLYKFYYLSMLNDLDSFVADLYPGDYTSADELAEEITTAHETLLNSGKQTLANIILEARGPRNQNYELASVLAYRHPSTYDSDYGSESSMLNFIRALAFIISMDLARQEGKEGLSLINGRLTEDSLDRTKRCDSFLKNFESYLYNREHGNEEQAKKDLRSLYWDSDSKENNLGCLPDLYCPDRFGGKDFLEIEKQAKDYFSILRAHKYNYAWAYVNGVYQMQLLAATEVAPKFIKFLATIEKEISPQRFLSADSNGKSLSIDPFLNQFKGEWDRELAADFKGTGLTWETFVAKIKEDHSLDKTNLMEQGKQSNVTFKERSENLAKSIKKLAEEHSVLHLNAKSKLDYLEAKWDVVKSIGSFFEYSDLRTLSTLDKEDIDYAAGHAAQNLMRRLVSLTYEVLEYQKHMMATGNGSDRILHYYANELVHSKDYCANPDKVIPYTPICAMVDWTIFTFKQYKIANKITNVGYLESTFLQNRNIITRIFNDSVFYQVIVEAVFAFVDIMEIFEGLSIFGKVAKAAKTTNKVRKIVKATRTANKVQDSLSVVNQSKKMLNKAKSWIGSNNITNKLNRLKKASNSAADVAQAEKVANAENYLKQADALLEQADSYAAKAEKYLGEGDYLRANYYANKSKNKGFEAAEFIDKAEDEVRVFQQQAKQRRKESALNNIGDARPATGNAANALSGADNARHSANKADDASRGADNIGDARPATGNADEATRVGNSTENAAGGGDKATSSADEVAELADAGKTKKKPDPWTEGKAYEYSKQGMAAVIKKLKEKDMTPEELGKFFKDKKNQKLFNSLFKDDASRKIAKSMKNEELGKMIKKETTPFMKSSVASGMADEVNYVSLTLEKVAKKGGSRIICKSHIEINLNRILPDGLKLTGGLGQKSRTFKLKKGLRADELKKAIDSAEKGTDGTWTISFGKEKTKIRRPEYERLKEMAEGKSPIYIELGKNPEGAINTVRDDIRKIISENLASKSGGLEYDVLVMDNRLGDHELWAETTYQFFDIEKTRHYHFEYEVRYRVDGVEYNSIYNVEIPISIKDSKLEKVNFGKQRFSLFDNDVYNELLISSYFIKEYDINGLYQNPLSCNNGRGFYFA